MRLAKLFAEWVDASKDLERVAPVPLSGVCFRARGNSADDAETDNLNQQLLERINTDGEVFLSHTRLNGRFTLRLAIGHIRTTDKHVRRAWELLVKHRNLIVG